MIKAWWMRVKLRLAQLVLLIVAGGIANAVGGPLAVIAAAGACTAGWVASLFLKEWQSCPACGGQGKHSGWIAKDAYSFCVRCLGTKGLVVRFAVRFTRPARARQLLEDAGVTRQVWRG